MTRFLRAVIWTIPMLVILVAPSPGRATDGGVPEDAIEDLGILGELRAERHGACSSTTCAALRACRHEVEDDYWIDVGKCLNLEDENEREACMEGAHAARREALVLCREQFLARRDVCELLGRGPYDPEVEPKDFLTPAEIAANPNPYFPLVPGTRWVYQTADEIIEVNVTSEVKEILGVPCVVVTDVVKAGGVLIEDTIDWYTQDEDGNVWYFGEIVQNFEDGELVSLDGSWKAGVDGAKPGIVMNAVPDVDDAYRQEFALGNAEDLAEVLSVTGTESVPAASCDGDCVVTTEYTPIEPGAVAHKYYAQGVGMILEIKPDTGEREELVEFDSPGGAALRVALAAASSGVAAVQVDTQFFPNPFGSETSIRFALPQPTDVAADVYDAAGRRVRPLVRGLQGAGGHTLRWDGTDADGNRVAAGIYFVRVKTGDEAQSRKVVLVR